MANLDLILESIKNKAEEEKNQILLEAKNQAQEIIDKSKEESKIEIEKILSEAKKQAELIKANEDLSSSRKARDIKNKAKNELIDKVLDELLSRLKNLDESQYKKFVINRLKDFSKDSGEIFLKENTAHLFDKEDLRGLSVSHETIDDGFLIKDGKIIYDNSFSSIIDYDKDELKKIISDQLFSEGMI